MERGRFIRFSAISMVCLIAAVIIVLIYLNMSTDTAEVHLPAQTAGISSDVDSDGDGIGELNTLTYAELRPDTVQYILEIIEKPKSYSCRYTVESFWEGGSSAFDVAVYVKDSVFSVTLLNDSYMKRCIFTDDEYYIWYIDEREYYHGRRGSALDEERIADAVQMSGSYKTLMELDTSSILETSYVEVDGIYCVYVNAEVGELGYRSEYYIYPDTGLLLKNEIYDGETLIYRMNSSDAMLSAPNDDYFTLPNGKLVS